MYLEIVGKLRTPGNLSNNQTKIDKLPHNVEEYNRTEGSDTGSNHEEEGISPREKDVIPEKTNVKYLLRNRPDRNKHQVTAPAKKTWGIRKTKSKIPMKKTNCTTKLKFVNDKDIEKVTLEDRISKIHQMIALINKCRPRKMQPLQRRPSNLLQQHTHNLQQQQPKSSLQQQSTVNRLQQLNTFDDLSWFVELRSSK